MISRLCRLPVLDRLDGSCVEWIVVRAPGTICYVEYDAYCEEGYQAGDFEPATRRHCVDARVVVVQYECERLVAAAAANLSLKANQGIAAAEKMARDNVSINAAIWYALFE